MNIAIVILLSNIFLLYLKSKSVKINIIIKGSKYSCKINLGKQNIIKLVNKIKFSFEI